MTAWQPILVLPNVDLVTSIAAGDVVMVSGNDLRVRELGAALPSFKTFLSRFSDAFGVRFKPAVLLVAEGVADRFLRVDALAAFRDAVAMAAIPLGRVQALTSRAGHQPQFGETFEF